MKRYEIQTRIGGEWSNEFHDDDGTLLYASRADAEADLADLLKSVEEAHARGDMSAPYRKSDYRIRVHRG
jgi:hypothetical protein